MTILDLVKSRNNLAKKFTKDFRDQVKQNLKDYKAEDGWLNSFADDNKLHANVTKRYEVIIPMIFTQTEGMLASMFDRLPDLIVTQGGQKDLDKQKKVDAAHEYLKDKASLEQFMNTAAWWYILTGFVSAHAGYVQKGKEVQATNEMGEPLFDEMGEPLTITVYDEDDPEIHVADPMYTAFSPESKYSIKGDKIPYYTREKLMTVSDILRTYDVLVEPDSTVSDFNKDAKTGKNSELVETDLQRAKVIMYYGNLHEDLESELEELGIVYDPDGWYYVVSTRNKILHIERTPEDMKTCRVLKWYGVPTEFFGFGLGKLLKPFQKEKSLRRTQQSRYADVAAFPKLLIPMGTDIDEQSASDPREIPYILYDGDKPGYLSPPDLANVLDISEQKADQDAQQASGMLDLSQGQQQSSTVDTATGQAIFAEAAEKRIRYAKRNFMLFYKECVIMLLKLAKIYWSEDKLVSITDEEGNEEQIQLTADDLSDIDFDTDVKIDPDSLTVNKDVLRAQAIELYDRVKDDPIIKRREVFKDMMRIGFDKKDPEKYMKDAELQEGMQLVDVMSGQQYVVDESGEPVPMEAMQETAQPTGEGNVPSSPSGVMGSAQDVMG